MWQGTILIIILISMKIQSLATVMAVTAFSAIAASSSHAVVLANWTFETSAPTTAGPHAAELGMFASSSFASTNSGGTISNPAGNGSAESFSSTGWADGEYYEFITSTAGFTGITVSYAQAASNTGPGSFQFQYSTDGVNFIDFQGVFAGPTADFAVATPNAANVLTFDLSEITALNNQASVGFRVAVSGSLAENGTTLAGGGTFRIDDFVVNGVPEPSTALLGVLGALTLLRRRR